MAIPDKIRALKPTQFGAVEIREFSGHYYVYEISSKWDPVKKKARKVQEKEEESDSLMSGNSGEFWGSFSSFSQFMALIFLCSPEGGGGYRRIGPFVSFVEKGFHCA